MRPMLLCFVLCLGVLYTGSVLFLSEHRPRNHARRSSCQSNLKLIGLALQQYVQDYDERLPPARVTSSTGWVDVIFPYIKAKQIFQCPSAPNSDTNFSSDYFYNRNLARVTQDKITRPATTLWVGDGADNSPTWASQTRLPPDSAANPDSPARRHLDTANYLFTDAHVKYLTPLQVKPTWWRLKP